MGMIIFAFIAFVILINYVSCLVTFSSPTRGSLHAIGSQVTATLSGMTLGSIATITQSCETTPPADVSINVFYSSPSAVFTLPAGYYGICTYFNNVGSQPVSIRVGNSVGVTAPEFGAVVLAGSDLPITVTYAPDTDPNPIFEVQLRCITPGIDPVEGPVEGNASTQQYFHIPSDFHGFSDLTVLNTVPSYYNVGSKGIQVVQTYQLTLETPQNGAELVIGTPFNVLVTLQDLFIPDIIGLQFSPSSGQTILAYINEVKSVVLDSTYFGANTLTILTMPPYLAPSPISITLKYGIEFTQAPVMIIGNLPFQLYLTTSATPVAPADQSVTVYLNCDATQIDQWNGVPLNQLTTLSLNTPDFQASSNCFFSTPSQNDYYYIAMKSVELNTNPNVNPVNRLSPEEQNYFARSIAFPPSRIVDPKNFVVNTP